VTDGILQFAVAPTITGVFAVIAAWAAAKAKAGKRRLPALSRQRTSLSTESSSPKITPEQASASLSKRLRYALFAIIVAVVALGTAILGLIGIFGANRIVIGLTATAASLLAFLAGAVIMWTLPYNRLTLAERRSSTMLTRAFVWIIAPIAGVALSLGLSGAGVNPITVAEGGSPAPLRAPFPVNGYYTPSGFMGDTAHITLNAQWTTNCQVGPSCMKFQYKPENLPGEPVWAGVYWQSPPGNWGDQPGKKIEGASKLVFWARGENGGELVSFKVGGTRGKKYEDSLEVAMDPSPVQLTSHWQQYEIDLKKPDTSSVIGAFSWSTTRDGNPKGATFYLDGIRME
jgi:hypothetical protein